MLLLSNVLGIALAYYGVGVMSLVYSQLFYFGAELVVLLWFQPLPLKFGSTKKHWKDLIGYGSGLTLIRFNTYIVNFGIILEVGKLVQTAVLGVFDRSFRIMNIPQRFLYDMVQRVMMPALVKKTDTAEGTFAAFEKTLSLIISCLLPLTVFLILFSKQIVLILLGQKWLDAVPFIADIFSKPSSAHHRKPWRYTDACAWPYQIKPGKKSAELYNNLRTYLFRLFMVWLNGHRLEHICVHGHFLHHDDVDH
jgi:O-antigen/teichoic acid export membrane protein